MSKSLVQRWLGRFTSPTGDAGPGNASLMQKAQSSHASGNYGPAISAYREAIAAAPRDASAHLGLGMALYESGNGEDAALALEQALALEPSLTDAHRVLAAIYRADGKHGEAQRHYHAACAAAPGDESNYLDLCTLLVDQHRLHDARDAVAQGLAHLPHSANLHFYMGNLQQSLGLPEQALDAYRTSLAVAPDQVMVLRNMALCLQSRDDMAAALDAFRRIVQLAPDWAEAHHDLGRAELRNGDAEAAIGRIEQAIALDAQFAPAHCSLGEVLLSKHDPESALKHFNAALAIDPDLVGAHLGRGIALLSLDRRDDAERAYREVLEIAPDHIDSAMRLGYLLISKGTYDEALSYFHQVTQQDPTHADAVFSVGIAWAAKARQGERANKEASLEEAAAAYHAALALNPGFVEACVNLCAIHIEREEYDAASVLSERILSLDSRSAHAMHNLGVINEGRARHAPLAQRLAMYDTAIKHYHAAYALDANQLASLVSIAGIYYEQLRCEEATALYDQVLAIDPGIAPARMSLGMLQLANGNFDEGWHNYESRWNAEQGLERMQSSQPHWDGSADLHGRTILLYAEQGLGDSLQFIRYASVLASMGATVWVLAPAPLELLLASCPGVERVFGANDLIPPHDFVCPMLSIPKALKTGLATIPARIPYLRASAERLAHWREKMGTSTRLRVGLVWSGDPRRESRELTIANRMRSLHFDQFRPLLDVPDVAFYSIQVGKESAAQLDPASPVIDFTRDLTDFQETAAFAEHLDLAICVDTSTAHLIGAIGKPVWLLNRFNTCWRWMHKRQDSPWYPTMRIFRQQQLGAWEPVMAEVRTALAAEAQAHSRRD